MNIAKLFLLFAFIFLPQFVLAASELEQGKNLYQQHCSSCHGLTGGMNMKQRVAPPIAAVRLHYITVYPDKTSFVTAVSNWVEKQDQTRSLMYGAIRRFKLMPKISINKEDAEKIARYIYAGNIEKPAGFDKHVEQQHGKR